MNNGVENDLSKILSIGLVLMVFILFILIGILIVIKIRQRQNSKSTSSNIKLNSNSSKTSSKRTAIDRSYSKQSIFDFMEFEDVQDNMIIQKKGKRFLMVVQCQGVNYDLMSHMEKVSVEEGFQQFLNTLRHPVQIYIQTRSVNLDSSINTYKTKVREIEDQLNKLKYQYEQMRESGSYTQEQLQRQYYDVRRQQNLYEYAKDIVSNTEKMNKNKNVLNKQYYVIIPYYSEEDEKYDAEEIKNMAFSELYTKAQAVIRTLSACSIVGRILNSKELIELLYVAYNRDESETYGIEKALKAGYNELYSTSQDVFEKKIKVLDQEIEDRAIDIANESVDRVKSRLEQNAEDKEEDMEDIATDLAKNIIRENQDYLGYDVTQAALDDIDINRRKGGKK